MRFRIGLIPGIIGAEIQADFFGALKKVAEIGYEGIEGGGRLLEGDLAAVTETRKRLDEIGLAVATIGAKKDALANNLEELIEKGNALGADHLTTFWGPCESKEALLEDAAFYDRVGERCLKGGLKFCYHNHDHEFKNTFDGRFGLDVLIEHTEHVFIELDVAWVTYGGADPAQYIRQHRGRIPVIHVKDIADMKERGAFTAVGTGLVDVAGSVRAAVECGAKWVVVEQDRPRNLTPMESITASFLNMKEAGLLGGRA